MIDDGLSSFVIVTKGYYYKRLAGDDGPFEVIVVVKTTQVLEINVLNLRVAIITSRLHCIYFIILMLSIIVFQDTVEMDFWEAH